MIFNTYPVPADLNQYIRCFWILESTSPPTLPFIHRATAECCPELIFYFKGEVNFYKGDAKGRTFASGLYAQSEAYRKFAIDKPFGMLGIHLYPHTLPLLFNIAASDLSDHNVDIKSLFGKDGDMLENEVMCADSHEVRVDLISIFFRSQLRHTEKRASYLSATITHAIKTGTMQTVNEMATACNLSVRQLERDFKALSGFSPRLFSNLTRFRSLMENLPLKAFSMADLAYAFNYYDQSHFIREFKRFTGLSPTQYMKDRMGVHNERMTPETDGDR